MVGKGYSGAADRVLVLIRVDANEHDITIELFHNVEEYGSSDHSMKSSNEDLKYTYYRTKLETIQSS